MVKILLLYGSYYFALLTALAVYPVDKTAAVWIPFLIIVAHFLLDCYLMLCQICNKSEGEKGTRFKNFLKKRYGGAKCCACFWGQSYVPNTVSQRVNAAGDVVFVAALIIGLIAVAQHHGENSSLGSGEWWLLWGLTMFGNTMCIVKHGCSCTNDASQP